MTEKFPMSDAAYRLDHVSFRYHDGGKRNSTQAWALHDLSLSVEPGEILGLIGPNGSGKSSLIKLMAGLVHAQQGTVHLEGVPVDACEPKHMARRVAAMFQDVPIGFPFSVTEIVLMGRYPHHRTSGLFSGWAWETGADRAIALRAMRETDICHVADQQIDRISTGERQRVYLARALAQEPRVLLLDEPTAHLDMQHLVHLGSCLRRLNREQELTMVVVTHDLNLASQLCSRLLLLSGGRMAAIGPPAEVLREEVLSAAYGCSMLVDRHPGTSHPRVSLHIPAM